MLYEFVGITVLSSNFMLCLSVFAASNILQQLYNIGKITVGKKNDNMHLFYAVQLKFAEKKDDNMIHNV